MGLPNPLRRFFPGATTAPAPATATQQQQTPATANTQPLPNGPAQASQGQPGPSLQHVQAGQVSLISYTPEESLAQVEAAREKVEFGQSTIMKFMARFNDLWAVIGPLLYAVGTITEIFIVLWTHQKDQSDYIAGMAIVIVSVIVEGGLLAVSFSSKLLRNRAEKRPTGMTRHEKAKLGKMSRLWFFLSFFVAATQIAFIISTTNGDGIGGLASIIAIAVVRACAAIVADYYTAFISEEEPSDGDKAISVQEEATEFTSKMLEQKRTEVEIINVGAIKVQEAAQQARVQQERTAQKAAMEMDRLKTEQELDRLENEAKIARAKAQHENDAALIRLQIASMKATQLVLMNAVKSIGPGSARGKNGQTEPLRVVKIEEEDV